MAIRILIVDDHGLIRAGLRALLEDEDGLEVVGEAASAEELLPQIGQLHPDIVLLDIGLPGMDGIEATRRIKARFPEVLTLILSVYEEESMLHEAISAGASGYIVKRAAEAELIYAVRTITQGYLYIHPAITRLLLPDLSPPAKTDLNAFGDLTPREIEIMGYIIRGFTNRQVAEALTISVRTVEGHRSNLMGKLGLKSRVELVDYAEKNGLIH